MIALIFAAHLSHAGLVRNYCARKIEADPYSEYEHYASSWLLRQQETLVIAGHTRKLTLAEQIQLSRIQDELQIRAEMAKQQQPE